MNLFLNGLQTFGQIITAGIAITAFSLFLYALTFNLRDRVARSFAIILLCIVGVFTGKALGSAATSASLAEVWLRLQWVGLVFYPSGYLHFSDALLAKTGRPSRGRRRWLVRLTYLISLAFLLTLPAGWLVGPLREDARGLWHLQATWLTGVFTAYYGLGIGWALVNLWRAYGRTVTPTSRRRMLYLLVGALAPALGSFPYLVFGSHFATWSPLLFWLITVVVNLLVVTFLVSMAYAVAFFGVSWPDRVVKRRLGKWLMRGPVTASLALGVMTFVRRAGQVLGMPDSLIVPVLMVVTVLVMEHTITLAAPLWERWFFDGADRADLHLLQNLEERLLTSNDLRQFLETVVAAICDQLQVPNAFVAALGPQGSELLVHIGPFEDFSSGALSENILHMASESPSEAIFTWGDYWLLPLYAAEDGALLGLLGVVRPAGRKIDPDQREALLALSARAALALSDRRAQQQVFSSLKSLTPQVELIQRLRAASRYDQGRVLAAPEALPPSVELSQAVKDALTHYWGGPKLTSSPLIRLRVVQQALEAHEENPVNALRSILRQAIESMRPEGERRFTGEWILYNILEMKFMEGRKVREVALRLAMSEADLYRKQRVAIESVAKTIAEMELKIRGDEYGPAAISAELNGSERVSLLLEKHQP